MSDIELGHCYVTLDRDGIYVLDSDGRGRPRDDGPALVIGWWKVVLAEMRMQSECAGSGRAA